MRRTVAALVVRRRRQHHQSEWKVARLRCTCILGKSKHTTSGVFFVAVLGALSVAVVLAATVSSNRAMIPSSRSTSRRVKGRRTMNQEEYEKMRYDRYFAPSSRVLEETQMFLGDDDLINTNNYNDNDGNPDQNLVQQRHNAFVEDGINRWNGWLELRDETNTNPIVSSSRRAHSTAVYKHKEREYMIITGGFTDSDWSSFPVYAYDMASTQTNTTTPSQGEWFNLGSNKSSNNDDITWPTGRAGHISAISSTTGHLYVFGGLAYHKDDFYTVDQFIWKAQLTAPFQPNSKLTWEKITMTAINGDEFIPRGETTGGIWTADNGEEYFIIYGGLSISSTKPVKKKTLGDLWAFHIANQTFEQWYPSSNNYNNDNNNSSSNMKYYDDVYNEDYPFDRTAHASTIYSNKLFVHGGMTLITEAWSPPQQQNDYAMLNDVWEFDLVTRTWRKKMLEPAISRSYHSIVSKNQTIVLCGGFSIGDDVLTGGIPTKKAYADVFLSFSDDSFWYQPVLPSATDTDTAAAALDYTIKELPPRYQHSASVDMYGSIYVWGGRFQFVDQIKPSVWRLDLLNSIGDIAPAMQIVIAPDRNALDDYDAERAEYQLMVAILIVTSVLFTTLLSALRRQVDSEGSGGSMNVPGGVVVTSFGIIHLGGDSTSPSSGVNRRGGVSQDILDALPVKTYRQGSTTTSSNSSSIIASRTSNTNNHQQQQQEQRTTSCLICLVDYETGDEVRTLPCCHDFHKHCVDSWLYNHSSCPACRCSIDRSNAFMMPSQQEIPADDDDDDDHNGVNRSNNDHNNESNNNHLWGLFSLVGRNTRDLFANRLALFRIIDNNENFSSHNNTNNNNTSNGDIHPQSSYNNNNNSTGQLSSTNDTIYHEEHSLQLHVALPINNNNNSVSSRTVNSNFDDTSDGSVNAAVRTNSSRTRRLLLNSRSGRRRGSSSQRAVHMALELAAYSSSSLIEEENEEEDPRVLT